MRLEQRPHRGLADGSLRLIPIEPCRCAKRKVAKNAGRRGPITRFDFAIWLLARANTRHEVGPVKRMRIADPLHFGGLEAGALLRDDTEHLAVHVKRAALAV